MWLSLKPFNVTISNASQMVLPPISPDPAGISDWVENTAYTYGEYVRNGGKVYWCVVAGTSAASGGPTQEDGDEVDNSATWRRVHATRNNVVLVNDSDTVMYLGIGVAAEANKGIRLNASGGTMNWLRDYGTYPPECAIYAIAAAAGTKVLAGQEG